MPRDHDEEFSPRPRQQRLAGSKTKGQKAPSSLPLARERPEKNPVRKAIELGLHLSPGGNDLSKALARLAQGASRQEIGVARRILYAMEKRTECLLDEPRVAASVLRVARYHGAFLRDPADARVTASTPKEQLREIAGHAFERWAVPRWLDDVWQNHEPWLQRVFIHLGNGGNLRNMVDLPFKLTSFMAHHAVNAPRGLNAFQALRWGQLRGLDVPEELCHELIRTRLAHTLPDEPFWKSVGVWFALHPEVIGHAATIVDYVYTQKIGDFDQPRAPDFEMQGRAPDRLIQQAQYWHQLQARVRRGVVNTWKTCGIAGWTEPADKAPMAEWIIRELTTTNDLIAEGTRLHHCVATYSRQAALGRSAIFSLRQLEEGEHQARLTLEVWPLTRQIVQARGFQNRNAEPREQAVIQRWTAAQNLKIESTLFAPPPRGRRRD
jgi:hypothetical protein